MRYSEIALNILAAKECGIIKTNAQFIKEFPDRETFEEKISNNIDIENMKEKLIDEFENCNEMEGMLCIYDNNFPMINRKVKNNSEKPHLLFYKGNISLLSDLNKNVAVIGLLNPEEQIVVRETEIVKELVSSGMTIVSGLAEGCDTVAHRVCLDLGGKTVAILPSQVNHIYPATNKKLADEIVEKDGLLLSEYYKKASSRRESISRFIERDRLQAMFTKAIVLTASYRKGEGDSGSRHAMEAARKYEIERYVMYNPNTDKGNIQFGLNSDLLNSTDNKVKIIHTSSIERITLLQNEDLIRKTDFIDQLSLI